MRHRYVIAGVIVAIALGAVLIPAGESACVELAVAERRLGDGVWRAIVVGDSVARGAGDEKGMGIGGYLADELRSRSHEPLIPINLGLDGARTANVVALLSDPSVRGQVAVADLIVISLGGNDLYGDARARLLSRLLPLVQRERTGAKVARVIAAIQRINPAARIFVLGLYNPYRHTSLATWLNTQVNLWDGNLIRLLASEPNVTVLRIADLLARDDRISALDRFHPASLGYRAIARRIADTL